MGKSLLVVTLEAVGILGSELMSFFLLSPRKDNVKAPEEALLKAKEAKTLLEKYLAVQ